MNGSTLNFCKLGLLWLLFSATGTSQAQEVITLTTTKDAYVSPNRGNNGGSAALVVKDNVEGRSSTRNSWVGFDISQLSVPGQFVEKAELRLFLRRLDSATSTHTVYEGTSDWQEDQIEYVDSTEPEIFPSPVAQKALTSEDVNTWVVFDVTDYLNALTALGQSEVSFVIEAEDICYSHYTSRETRNTPELRVTMGEGSGPAPEVTLPADLTDDTMVRGGVYADLPYGDSTQMEVKTSSSVKFTRFGYTRFNVGPAPGEISEAKLRLYIRYSNGNSEFDLLGTETDWNEESLTFNQASGFDNEVFLGSIALTGADDAKWIEFDVTDYVGAMVQQNNSTSVAFAVKSDANVYTRCLTRDFEDGQFAPELIVKTRDAGDQSGGSTDSGGILVNDVDSLQTALYDAQAGDVIVVAPGTYAPSDSIREVFAGNARKAYFLANASGTPDAPIVLKAADPSNPPVLQGLITANSDYLLWIRGDHWVIQDLILERGGKGLMLDGSSNSVVARVTVRQLGAEGIHLRSGTSNTIIQDCVVRDAGENQPGFGEGIYVGSDVSQWDQYEKRCDYNQILGCDVGATTAECIDVKEGTHGTIIENCVFYGDRISGHNSANSFIDLKGVDGRVRNNRFYKENNSTVTRGVAIVHRRTDPTAERNWIYDNHFFLDDADGVMVHAFRGFDNFAWDNVRSPAGDEYQGNSPELAFEPQE